MFKLDLQKIKCINECSNGIKERIIAETTTALELINAGQITQVINGLAFDSTNTNADLVFLEGNIAIGNILELLLLLLLLLFHRFICVCNNC